MIPDTAPVPAPAGSSDAPTTEGGTSPPHASRGARARRRRSRAGAALLVAALGGGPAAADVTVAFLGDQSTHESARDVLSMVRDEGADLVVLQGDLGYSSPLRWVENMEEILGPRFPVLAVVGNHEYVGWPVYERWLERRVDEVDELSCEGRVSVKARCTFRGITVVQGAPGVHEVPGIDPDDDYAGYIRDALSDDANAWRICSWHKLQRDMQVGGKDSNSTGWGVYEECREGGGIVATAHEHNYSRTYLMDDFEERSVVHRNDHLEIGPGRSFAFVSGLGGSAIRPQKRSGDWWASVYTATQGATHGALLCTFGERRASCRFRAIDGSVPDRFTLESANAEPRRFAKRPSSAEPTAGDRDEADAGRSPGSGPAAVTGLRSDVYSSRTAELSWNRAPAPVVRYEVRRDGETIATTDGTSHMDRGLAGRANVVHEVVAIDASGARAPAASVVTNPDASRPTPSAPSSGTTAKGTPSSGDDVTRGATIVPGAIEVRLNVYDRRSYELIWSRVPNAIRYRLSRSDGDVVQDGGKVSRYFRRIDSSLETGYRIEAIDADGRTLREASVRVAPRRSAQLTSLD